MITITEFTEDLAARYEDAAKDLQAARDKLEQRVMETSEIDLRMHLESMISSIDERLETFEALTHGFWALREADPDTIVRNLIEERDNKHAAVDA